MYEVAGLLYPEALATSLTLPAEILRASAQLSRARRSHTQPVRVRLFGVGKGVVEPCATDQGALDSGLQLGVDADIRQLDGCDLLILPAIWRHPRRVYRRLQPFLDVIRRVHDDGAIICSVGSASGLLAEAGLLDGRVATTHWQDFARFEAAYPAVQLKRRHLITQSDRVYCVGSVNSIADFTVHLVGRWYGDAIARAVESQFSPEARQSFAAAAFLERAPSAHHDALVRDTQDRMEAAPEKPHRLEDLAASVGLSARSLGRRFRQATGRAPMQYLRDLRLQEARALLQNSDLGVAEIGDRCGFASSSRFAQVFREHVGMSPRAYRAAVRGKRFAAISEPS
ncbi:MAG: helix-turn-helix domain-containing protein [Halieaceae bacterium]|jgi:transcriptional regulator GlxA family with amidase domain|nr:helix-turn-helix domain-containing protein [Halieaceae bacterium]